MSWMPRQRKLASLCWTKLASIPAWTTCIPSKRSTRFTIKAERYITHFNCACLDLTKSIFSGQRILLLLWWSTSPWMLGQPTQIQVLLVSSRCSPFLEQFCDFSPRRQGGWDPSQRLDGHCKTISCHGRIWLCRLSKSQLCPFPRVLQDPRGTYCDQRIAEIWGQSRICQGLNRSWMAWYRAEGLVERWVDLGWDFPEDD